jgi:hypothetical protein
MQPNDASTLAAAVSAIDAGAIAAGLVFYNQAASRFGVAMAGRFLRMRLVLVSVIGCVGITAVALIRWGDVALLPYSESAWASPLLLGLMLLSTALLIVAMFRAIAASTLAISYVAHLRPRHFIWSERKSEVADRLERLIRRRLRLDPNRSFRLLMDPPPRWERVRDSMGAAGARLAASIVTVRRPAHAPIAVLPEFTRVALRSADEDAIRVLTRALRDNRRLHGRVDASAVEEVVIRLRSSIESSDLSGGRATTIEVISMLAAVADLSVGEPVQHSELVTTLVGLASAWRTEPALVGAVIEEAERLGEAGLTEPAREILQYVIRDQAPLEPRARRDMGRLMRDPGEPFERAMYALAVLGADESADALRSRVYGFEVIADSLPGRRSTDEIGMVVWQYAELGLVSARLDPNIARRAVYAINLALDALGDAPPSADTLAKQLIRAAIVLPPSEERDLGSPNDQWPPTCGGAILRTVARLPTAAVEYGVLESIMDMEPDRGRRDEVIGALQRGLGSRLGLAIFVDEREDGRQTSE